MKAYIVIAISILTISCQKKESGLKHFSSTIEKSINEFRKDDFFTKVNDIEVLNNQIYFVDKNLAKIFVSNLNLEYVRSFGEYGEGPLQLISPSWSAISENEFFVFDVYTAKMVAFNLANSNEVNSFRIDYLDLGDFFVKKDHLFFSDRDEDAKPIIKFNFKSQLENKRIGFQDLEEIGKPKRHAVDMGNGFLSIYAENKPVFEYYDYEGNHLKTFNFSTSTIFKDYLEYTPPPPNISGNTTKAIIRTYKNTIWQAKFKDNQLYLLILSQKDGQTESNTLVILNWENENLIPAKIIDLPSKGWYSRFDVLESSKRIVAFDEINGAIEIIKIK